MTNVFANHIETKQLICPTNQFTGFYMRGTWVVQRLRKKNKALNTQETLFARLLVIRQKCESQNGCFKKNKAR